MAVEKRESRYFKRAAKAFFKRCNAALTDRAVYPSSVPYGFDLDACSFFCWGAEDHRLGVKMREYFWDLTSLGPGREVSFITLESVKHNASISDKSALEKVFEEARESDVFFGFGFSDDKRVMARGETLESLLVEADLTAQRTELGESL